MWYSTYRCIYAGNLYRRRDYYKYKKLSYRSTKLYDGNILKYSNNLTILESDTENIIEYVENNLNKNKKKYKFRELINNDKK